MQFQRRALDRGGFHPPLDGHFLRVLADVDRVAAQIDDQVVGRRRLVDEIGEPGRRVFLAEYGERLAEPDILETEDRFGRFGDPVDRTGSDSVPGQNLAGRFSFPDNALLDVVPLLVDAEQQLDRFFLGRLFGRRACDLFRPHRQTIRTTATTATAIAAAMIIHFLFIAVKLRFVSQTGKVVWPDLL